MDITSLRKTLLVFQNHVYMTACSTNYSTTKFYRISLEFLLDPTVTLRWNQLEDFPASQCTNLSVLGNQLVTASKADGCLRMYAYISCRSTWIAVQEFQSPYLNIGGIIGLPCSSPSDQVEALFLVGVGRVN